MASVGRLLQNLAYTTYYCFHDSKLSFPRFFCFYLVYKQKVWSHCEFEASLVHKFHNFRAMSRDLVKKKKGRQALIMALRHCLLPAWKSRSQQPLQVSRLVKELYMSWTYLIIFEGHILRPGIGWGAGFLRGNDIHLKRLHQSHFMSSLTLFLLLYPFLLYLFSLTL